MSIKAKSKQVDSMEGRTMFEGSDETPTDVKRTKLESFHQTTLSPPTEGKTFRGFVKECRDNCLAQNDLKQPEADSSFAGIC